MMATTSDIGNPNAYDPQTNWSSYHENLSHFLEESDIEEHQYKAFLLAVIGPAGLQYLRSIYRDSTLRSESVTYDRLVQRLEAHFGGKISTSEAKAKFEQLQQREHQKVSDWICNLVPAAADCDFGTDLENQLQKQFIAGLCNKNIQSNLMGRNYDWKNCIKFAFEQEVIPSEDANSESQAIPCSVSSKTNGHRGQNTAAQRHPSRYRSTSSRSSSLPPTCKRQASYPCDQFNPTASVLALRRTATKLADTGFGATDYTTHTQVNRTSPVSSRGGNNQTDQQNAVQQPTRDELVLFVDQLISLRLSRTPMSAPHPILRWLFTTSNSATAFEELNECIRLQPDEQIARIALKTVERVKMSHAGIRKKAELHKPNIVDSILDLHQQVTGIWTTMREVVGNMRENKDPALTKQVEQVCNEFKKFESSLSSGTFFSLFTEALQREHTALGRLIQERKSELEDVMRELDRRRRDLDSQSIPLDQVGTSPHAPHDSVNPP